MEVYPYVRSVHTYYNAHHAYHMSCQCGPFMDHNEPFQMFTPYKPGHTNILGPVCLPIKTDGGMVKLLMCQTGNLRIACRIGSNPVGGKPFP